KVVAVACDTNGNIDVADLKSKADAHKNDLSCLIITYPSTHGVFEETIREICEIIHANGGQVYMDGANMNAQVGLTSPAFIGADGLTEATKFAILNANYISKRLEKHFPTLYRSNGLVAHECILDLRAFHSVTAEDVAKRLMDYGFHAPTLSWPVAGTLMVEPTESESKAELDRFCDALIAIHSELMAIESGKMDKQNNPLKNAPHTADMIAAENWNHPYS